MPLDVKDRLNINSFDSYIKDYYNRPTQNRVKPQIKPEEKHISIVKDSYNTTNNYYYIETSDKDEPYKMGVIPATLIMILGVYIIFYIAQMDISRLFFNGILSIKFFEPIRQLYFMAS